MEALAREWNDVPSRLDDDQSGRLRDLVVRFVDESDLNVSGSIAEDIMDLLLEVLPTNHPVLIALQRPQDRLRDMSGRATDQAWRQVAESLRARLRRGSTRGDGTSGEADDAHDEHGVADHGGTGQHEQGPGRAGPRDGDRSPPGVFYDDGWPGATRGSGPPGTSFGDDDDDDGLL
jgi:hypothetical protein